MFSNKHFDPVAGSRLYNEYLEHYLYAEEMGIDGIMLNEHHNAPFCMQAKCNIFASILAAATKKVKIVLLGNPLPLADNPVRLAEELSMIDMISKGRLVSGLCPRRRAGAARDRRQPGLQPRALRGSARPDRQGLDRARPVPLGGHALPAPRRQPVGGAAAEAASAHLDPRRHQPRRRSSGRRSTAIPYIALNTPVDRTKQIWKIYDDAAAEAGFTGGPDYHGLLKQIHVAETEEKAIENARQFMWMQGEFTGLAHPVWSTPVGLRQPGQPPRLCRVRHRPVEEPALPAGARKADGRADDHRRHAEAGDRQAARSCWRRRGPASSASGAMTAP